MKKLIAYVALVLGMAALVSPAAAGVQAADGNDKQRTTVGVRTSGASQPDNRGQYDYELAPKKFRDDYIAIYNYAFTPVTVRLLPRDASTTVDGDFTVQPSAEQPVDVGRWIAVAHPVVTIKPRTMKIVPFQLGVPYNASPGDHVGAIIVSLLARQPGKGSGVVVEHRVGLRVYLRVPGELKPQLSLDNLRSTFSGALTGFGLGRTKVSYDVRNTGNIRLSATQVVRLSRSFGLPDAATAKPAKIGELLPGSSIHVVQQLGRHWTIGKLKTNVTLDPKSFDKGAAAVPAVHAQVARTVIPWLLSLVIVALLGLGYGYRRWRRSRRPVADAGGPTTDSIEEKDSVLVREMAASGRHLNKHAAPKAPKKSHRRGGGRAGATALGILALVALSGAVVPGTADRAEAATSSPKIWKALIDPKSGTDDQPFSIVTTGACPPPSRNVIGRVYGAGFPAAGVNVVGNSSGSVSKDGPFEIPLQQTLRDTMVQQPRYTPLHGTYRIELRCIVPAYMNRPYGTYVAKIRFTDPQHWVALAPVTNVVGPHSNPDGSMTGPSSPGHPGTVTHPKTPTASPSPNGSGAASGGPNASANGQTSDAADSSSPSRWPAATLIGGGVLVAGATVLLLRKSRADT